MLYRYGDIIARSLRAATKMENGRHVTAKYLNSDSRQQYISSFFPLSRTEELFKDHSH